jgi:CheY-like chemotaxis protein
MSSSTLSMPASLLTSSAHVFTGDVAVDTATTPAAMSLSGSTKTTPVATNATSNALSNATSNALPNALSNATSQMCSPEETMSDITPLLSTSGSTDRHEQCNKVVCVDRDKQAARELTAVLESLTYEVAACAGDAFEAVRMVTTHDPDVVMVEVHLQDKFDGIALAQYLRDNFRAAIIFVTSDIKKDTLERALKMQPQGFLNKPYRPLDVRNALALAGQHSQVHPQLEASGQESNRQESSVQGRLEKIGGTLPALQLLTIITPHGKLVFDDGAEIVVSQGDVVDVQHPSRKQRSKQVLDDIIRRQQGCFRVDVLESAPKGSFKASVNGLLLQYQLDTDDIDRTLYDLRRLSLEAVDPYKHPSQLKESDSLIIETLGGDDDLNML